MTDKTRVKGGEILQVSVYIYLPLVLFVLLLLSINRDLGGIYCYGRLDGTVEWDT